MKRKGFTLIELLAVIVILAVIAIIAVPIIGNVIGESRKKSFQITCNEVYRSYEQYEMMEEINGSTGDCTIFEFSSDRIETELIEEIKYEPVSKLSLKGELPESGTYKICNGKRELAIDNGEYTCIIDEKRNEILNGKVEENDITNPIIEGINLNSTTNSIRVTVNGLEEDGAIKKYYYSINGEEYKESELNKYKYEGLETNKEYEIKVVVENASGLKSEEYTKKIKTKEIVNPDIKEISKIPEEGYEYATSRTIEITYQTENIENAEYYFKSSVTVEVAEGTAIGTCGTGTIPRECEESNITTLEAETWYKTNSTNSQITYQENGTLYALVSDGKNVSGTSTWEVTKIDTIIPEVKANVNGKEVAFTMTDNIGVIEYGVNKSTTEEPTYILIESTSNAEKIWTAEESGTYVVWVKDVSGRTNQTTFTIDDSAFGAIVTYEVNGTKYEELHYNGTSVVSPTTFTPTLSGYEFVGWREDTIATSEVITEKTMSGSPITLYAVFRQNVTVTYYNNSTTASITSNYRYINNGNIVNPTFNLTQASRSGWTVRGWSTGTAGNSAIIYNNATAFTRDSNITLYGMYQQTITLTYRQVSASANQTTTGIRYYNSNGAVVNPKFTLTPSGYGSEWTFRGWTTSTAANAGVTYSSISNREFSANTTVYVLLQRPVTLSYNGNGATSGSTTSETKYYYLNSYNGNTVLAPSFTLKTNGFAMINHKFDYWSQGSTSGAAKSPGTSVTLSANTTFYAHWSQISVLAYSAYAVGADNTSSTASKSITLSANRTYLVVAYGNVGPSYDNSTTSYPNANWTMNVMSYSASGATVIPLIDSGVKYSSGGGSVYYRVDKVTTGSADRTYTASISAGGLIQVCCQLSIVYFDITNVVSSSVNHVYAEANTASTTLDANSLYYVVSFGNIGIGGGYKSNTYPGINWTMTAMSTSVTSGEKSSVITSGVLYPSDGGGVSYQVDKVITGSAACTYTGDFTHSGYYSRYPQESTVYIKVW